MRVGVVQLCSSTDLEANLEAARRAVEEAAGLGCGFVALPENFAYLRREGEPIPCAQPLEGEIVGRVRELAERVRQALRLAGCGAISAEALMLSADA